MVTTAAAVERIIGALSAARRGGGRVFTVEGPPRIGRSTLLAALVEAAPRSSKIVRVTGRWGERAVPFGVLRDGMRQTLGDRRLPASISAPMTALGLRSGAVQPLDDAAIHHGALAALELVTARVPMLLIVDDAQWVDGPSLGWLAHLARRIEQLPVVAVVAVATPLPFLSPVDVLLSLSERLGLDPPSGAQRDAGRLDTALRQRLSEAGTGARRAAHALSIVDGHADVDLLAAVTGDPAERVLDALDELTACAVLEAPMQLHRSVVAELASSPSAEHQVMAARAAHALARRGDEPLAAQRLLELDPIGDAWARRVLVAAGRSAAAAGQHASAAALLRRALREPSSGDDAGVLVSLAASCTHALLLDDARAAIATAARCGDPAASLGLVASGLAAALVRAGRAESASDLLMEVDAYGVLDRESKLWIAAARLGLRLLVVSADHPALDVRPDELAGATAGECAVLATLACEVAWRDGDLQRGGELARRAVDGGHLVRVHSADPAPLFMALDVLVDAAQLDVAFVIADALVDDAQTGRSPTGFHRACAFRAYLRTLVGDMRGAEQDARLAVEGELGAVDTPLAFGALARALVAAGRLDDASCALGDAAGADEVAATWDFLLFAAAELALAKGDDERVFEVSRSLEAHERDRGRVGVPFLWRSIGALAAARRGDIGGARRLADDELAIAAATGHGIGLATALRVRALVGPPAERRRSLEEALDTARGCGSRLVHAQVLADLGAELRRTNRAVAARPLLREAVAIASACGAAMLVAVAADELRATGAKPRRVETTGPGALTAMERRIIDEARRGRSNPEIAAALFITRKTVEMHLTRAYRKLQITSRRELAALDFQSG